MPGEGAVQVHGIGGVLADEYGVDASRLGLDDRVPQRLVQLLGQRVAVGPLLGAEHRGVADRVQLAVDVGVGRQLAAVGREHDLGVRAAGVDVLEQLADVLGHVRQLGGDGLGRRARAVALDAQAAVGGVADVVGADGQQHHVGVDLQRVQLRALAEEVLVQIGCGRAAAGHIRELHAGATGPDPGNDLLGVGVVATPAVALGAGLVVAGPGAGRVRVAHGDDVQRADVGRRRRGHGRDHGERGQGRDGKSLHLRSSARNGWTARRRRPHARHRQTITTVPGTSESHP
jgi:hypothetical protein